MQKFLTKHAASTTGTLSCFDRVLFKGRLALGYDLAPDPLLRRHGVLVKDFKSFVLKLPDRLKVFAIGTSGHSSSVPARPPISGAARRSPAS